MSQLEEIARNLRIDIIKMVAAAKSGHPGGSLSCIDILCALYFGGVLKHDPANPEDAKRDRFILSKGHAAPALYATLANAGYFPREELLNLRKLGSILQGHPDCRLLPGVEVSTGSLGQGLSTAIGLAEGLRLSKSDSRVFVVLGDGECQEGQVWEAAMYAAHRKLNNLVAIVDRNQLQIDGNTEDVCDLGDMAKKFEAFGWDAHDIDGHDLDKLTSALKEAKKPTHTKPQVFIAHTIKGKGVSFMEGEASWHGSAPNEEQMVCALSDLGCSDQEIKDIQKAIADQNKRNKDLAEELIDKARTKAGQPSVTNPEAHRSSVSSNEKADDILCDDPLAKPEATRAAYGKTLIQLIEEGLPVVAVDADLTGSTTTNKLKSLDSASDQHLFNVGIAEQNMIDVASGLSLTGRIAFTGSFAVFGTGRVYDQIRNTVCYSNLNVKIAPTHAGTSVGADGGSHQMLEDINLMRGLPNMRILVPADYAAASAAIRLAAQTPGPVYVRMGRAKVPRVYKEGLELCLGGAFVLREGSDVSILACGIEVEQALKAADKLAKDNISAEVIDVYSIKPLPVDIIARSAAKTGAVVTVEEHSVIGGLGSAVAEALGENAPVRQARIGMNDIFGKSASHEELLAYFGLDEFAIVKAVKSLIALK